MIEAHKLMFINVCYRKGTKPFTPEKLKEVEKDTNNFINFVKKHYEEHTSSDKLQKSKDK